MQRSAELKVDYVVVHPPTSWGQPKAKHQLAILYWTKVRNHLATEPKHQAPVSILGDYNIRFADFIPAVIGDVLPGEQDKVGDFVHSIILKYNVAVPAAFSTLHRGDLIMSTK